MVIIEGKHITDKETLWKELHKNMKLPEYFGNNLDALADVLSKAEREDTGKNIECAGDRGKFGGLWEKFFENIRGILYFGGLSQSIANVNKK